MTPPEIGSIVTMVKEGMTGTAALIAVRVAWLGLDTWKRQLQGNANHELARRLLRTTYKLREAIKFVRNPFIPGSETDAALATAGLGEASEAEKKRRAREVVYEARWKPVVEARIEFDAEMLEAEVLWGSRIQTVALGLRGCMGEMYVCVGDWVSDRAGMEAADFKRVREVIFEAGDESNAYSRRLAEAVGAMEGEIRPHLALQ